MQIIRFIEINMCLIFKDTFISIKVSFVDSLGLIHYITPLFNLN